MAMNTNNKKQSKRGNNNPNTSNSNDHGILQTPNTGKIDKTLASLQTNNTDLNKAKAFTDSPLFTGSSFSGDTPLLDPETINAQNLDADNLMNINNNIDSDKLNLDMDMTLGAPNAAATPTMGGIDLDPVVNDINPTIVTNPIIVSPSQSSTSSGNLQALTPLNPDLRMSNSHDDHLKSGNTPDTYTLANYYHPGNDDQGLNQPRIVHLDEAGNPTEDDFPKSLVSDNVSLNPDFQKNVSPKSTNLPLLPLNKSTITAPLPDSKHSMGNRDDRLLASFKKPGKKKMSSLSHNKKPAFVEKLWKMINDPENNKYISWMPNGKAIQVVDRENFMKFVLPKFFKHNNFASFVRQLNMYGWRKVQDVNAGTLAQIDEVWQFENPNFLKDREDLLENIVRQKPGSNDDEEYNIKYLLEQLDQMKRNQVLITEDLRRVRNDNELLWKENFIARERHKIQSDTLDKIMRFLANIYGNNTSKLIEQMNNNGEIVEINDPHNPNAYSGYYNNANNHNHNHDNLNNNGINNFAVGRNMAQNYGADSRSQMVMGNSMAPYNQVAIQNGRYPQVNDPNSNNINNYQQYSGGNTNQRYVDTNGNNQPVPYYNPVSSPYAQSSNDPNYNTRRRRLMITNQSNSSPNAHRHSHADSVSSSNSQPTTSPGSTGRSSNELRMNNLNYETSNAVHNNDSSIQEIHRGPENRNSDSLKSYIQQIPDFINNPRPFVEQEQLGSSEDKASNFVSPLPKHPLISQQQVLGRLGPPSSRTSHRQQQQQSQRVEPPVIPMTPLNDAMNGAPEKRVDSNSAQLMGNIQQKLQKNQGALKQVNDWLNKYSENFDNEEIQLPDDFKVEDFLQQPLDLSVSGTPIDFSNVEGFSNDNLSTTPLLGQAPLHVPSGLSNPIAVEDPVNPLKRGFAEVYGDDGTEAPFEGSSIDKRFHSG